MQTTIFPISKMAGSILFLTFFIDMQLQSVAQDDSSITVYQYRHVPDNKIDEFIKRETTYWSRVAEKCFGDY